MKNTKERIDLDINKVKKIDKKTDNKIEKNSILFKDTFFYLFIFVITYLVLFIFTGSISLKENNFLLKTNIPSLNIFLIQYIFIGFILSLKKDKLNFNEFKSNVLLNLGIGAAFYLLINIVFGLINKKLVSINIMPDYYLIPERIKMNALAFLSGVFIINVFNYINIKKYNFNKTDLEKVKIKKAKEEKCFKIYLRYILILAIYIIGLIFRITNIVYSIVSILIIVLIIKDIKSYLTKGNILRETKNIVKFRLKERIFPKKREEKNIIVYPYILEITSAMLLFIFMFLSKGENMQRKAAVFITSFSIIMLVKHLTYFTANKIYKDEQNEIKAKNKIKDKFKNKEIKSMREQVLYTLLFGIIFVSIIYLRPYKIASLFTNNLSIQNEVTNNIKFLMISIIINMISIFAAYRLLAFYNSNKNKKQVKKGAKLSFKNLNILNFILTLQSVLPYILIYISFKFSAYKYYLYSFFITDMIIFILVGIIYIRKRKNWVILEKY